MRITGLVAIMVVLLAITPVGADSQQEKILRDRQGSPDNYTTGESGRNGGDDCAGAPTITVALYLDSGNTTGFTDIWGPSVSGFGQDGEDQAYRIVITTADTINVMVTPMDLGFDLSTYIIGEVDCANYTPTVLAGNDSGGNGAPENFSYAAAPGT